MNKLSRQQFNTARQKFFHFISNETEKLFGMFPRRKSVEKKFFYLAADDSQFYATFRLSWFEFFSSWVLKRKKNELENSYHHSTKTFDSILFHIL